MLPPARATFFQQGYGGLGMFFAGVVIAVALYYLIFPGKFPENIFNDKATSQFCRPYVEPDGSIKPDAPTIMAPTYDGSVVRRGQPFPKLNPDDIQPYRLIKSTVPIFAGYFDKPYSRTNLQNKTPNEIDCKTYEYNGHNHSHFCQWIHEPLTISPNFSGANKYVVFYPAPYSDANTTDRYIGATDPFRSELSDDEVFRYGTYHILFLLHVDENNNPIPFKKNNEYFSVDVYQQVKKTDTSQPVEALPESVLKCIDEPLEESEIKLGPVMEKSPDKKQEQLGWFLPEQLLVIDTWYKPACKPAIYLYPKKDMFVNVKISINNGFLTYTDPLYPKDTGWSVIAKPNGTLHYLSHDLSDSKGTINYPSGIFPYLYYEGKIHDYFVTKPDQGFVIPYNDLETFFTETLPKLGLNQKETAEFKEYWLNALPKSPYYFIGIIPQQTIESNETLTITPKEDTMIRVRLFFQALDQFQTMQPPIITTPQRSGFTVIDWGGLVKSDKSHPFTCLQ